MTIASLWLNRRLSIPVGGALLLLSFVAQVTGQETSCPSNSSSHCDNPMIADAVWAQDSTVSCDVLTCEWDTDLLSPTQKPVHCVNMLIIQPSDSVSDLMEPCLLWEIMYGEFAPTAAPTTSSQPSTSPRPSAGPTGLPTVSPTFNPTSGPTLLPTSVPTLEPTGGPTLGPSRLAPSGDVSVPTGNVPATPSPPVEVTTPASPSEPASAETGVKLVSHNFNSVLLTYIFPNQQSRHNLRSLASLLTLSSRAELYYLTEAHMKNVIPNLEQLDLVLTPYQEVPIDGETAATEMLQGSLSLEVATEQADSINVDDLIRAAFSGNPLSTYLITLRMSSDPVLNTLSDVTYGIPLGVPDTVSDGSRGIRQEDSSSSKSGLWVIILVSGVVGLFGMLAAGFLVLSRNSENFRSAVGLKAANTGSYSHGSPTSSMEPQLIRRMQSVDMHDSPNGQGQEMKIDDDELPEGTQGGEDINFGDMQSEITSVYSYVDRTGLNESIMTDDQSYSLAPSFLVRKSIAQGEDSSPGLTSPTDERNGSVMWSVMDGLGDQSLAYKSPENAAKKSAAENSPSRLVISATRPNTDDNELYIFDDDVSVVSETSEMVASKITQMDTLDGRTASPGNDSFRSSLDGSLIKSVISRTKSLENFNGFQQDVADAKEDNNDEPTELPPNLASVLRPKDNAPDLSQVMETSEISRNTSRASTEGPRSAPSSAKKNRSRRSTNLDHSKEESADDDSSLFMGPDSFAKENLPDNSKILSLGEENKVTPSDEKNPYNITPLCRASGRLSDKDKVQLGIRRVTSKDDSSLAESMVYPGSYAVADFRDDMSISTVGSRRGTKYSITTMASF